MVNDDSDGPRAHPDQAPEDNVGARAHPAKLLPAVCLQDHVVRSDKEHDGLVDLFDKSVDSLGQLHGGNEGVGESLHILVHFVFGNALEMLCPAIAKDSHSALTVWWQRGGLLVLLVAFLLEIPLKSL